ncbi:MAG: winged helix-turn-helix domain-containing protein [archaeon]
MNKKRDRLEVIFDFLCVIRDHHNSIKRTPLLRKTNLSSQSFIYYFDELLAKEFIRQITDNQGKTYITLSDKGFAFLEKYALIKGFIEEFEL